MHLLEGPRLKLRWAAKHMVTLDEEVANYRLAHPHPITHSRDPDTGQSKLTIYKAADAIPEIALVAGDVIHNLRSALDHLYWQLILADGGTPGRTSFFPIWESAPSAKMIREFGDALSEGPRKAILEMQPFQADKKGRAHRLAELHRLDIVDKHHGLIVASDGFLMSYNFDQKPDEEFRRGGDEAMFFTSTLRSADGSVSVEVDARVEAIVSIAFKSSAGEQRSISLGEDGSIHAIFEHIETKVFGDLERFFHHD